MSCPAPSTRHHYENPPQLLCVDLCEEVQATREVHGASSLTAHILSVAASTFRHGSSSCLVFEIDMFMSSEDECHVTQAVAGQSPAMGSNRGVGNAAPNCGGVVRESARIGPRRAPGRERTPYIA